MSYEWSIYIRTSNFTEKFVVDIALRIFFDCTYFQATINYSMIYLNFFFFFFISAPPECDPGMLSCRQYHWNKTYCYPPHYKCDKTVDCVDGSDEENCGK